MPSNAYSRLLGNVFSILFLRVFSYRLLFKAFHLFLIFSDHRFPEKYPCTGTDKGKENESCKNQTLSWGSGSQRDSGRTDFSVNRCSFLHFRFSVLNLQGCFIIKIKSEGSLIFEPVSCHSCSLSGKILISVDIVGKALLSLIIVLLSLFVEFLGIFSVLTRFVGPVVSDIITEPRHNSVGKNGGNHRILHLRIQSDDKSLLVNTCCDSLAQSPDKFVFF